MACFITAWYRISYNKVFELGSQVIKYYWVPRKGIVTNGRQTYGTKTPLIKQTNGEHISRCGCVKYGCINDVGFHKNKSLRSGHIGVKQQAY